MVHPGARVRRAVPAEQHGLLAGDLERERLPAQRLDVRAAEHHVPPGRRRVHRRAEGAADLLEPLDADDRHGGVHVGPGGESTGRRRCPVPPGARSDRGARDRRPAAPRPPGAPRSGAGVTRGAGRPPRVSRRAGPRPRAHRSRRVAVASAPAVLAVVVVPADSAVLPRPRGPRETPVPGETPRVPEASRRVGGVSRDRLGAGSVHRPPGHRRPSLPCPIPASHCRRPVSGLPHDQHRGRHCTPSATASSPPATRGSTVSSSPPCTRRASTADRPARPHPARVGGHLLPHQRCGAPRRVPRVQAVPAGGDAGQPRVGPARRRRRPGDAAGARRGSWSARASPASPLASATRNGSSVAS